MDKQIQHTHIIRYIFVVAFIFAGLFSFNSNAFNSRSEGFTNFSETSK